MEHDSYCNCEGCWWARDQKEICPTCGSIVGEGCPEDSTEESDISE